MKSKNLSSKFIFSAILLSLSVLSSLQGWPMVRGFEKKDPQLEKSQTEQQEKLTDSTATNLSDKERGGSERAELKGIKEESFEDVRNIPDVLDLNTLDEKIIAAQVAQQDWKEMQQWIMSDHAKISFEDKNNLLEEARDAVEYWRQLMEQAHNVPEDIISEKVKEILRFARLSSSAAHEAEATQELLEKLVQSHPDSFSIRKLPMKQLPLEEPHFPLKRQEELSDNSSFSKEEKVSYYASEIIKLFPELLSPQPVEKKYEQQEKSVIEIATRVLEKYSQFQLMREDADSLITKSKSVDLSSSKQAKVSREKADQLRTSAQKIAQKARLAYQQLEHDIAISFYSDALELAAGARSHAQSAIEAYKARAWRKISEKIDKALQEKIREWNIEKCRAAQQLAEVKKKNAEEERKLADQEESNEIGTTWDSMASKFGVLSNHFNKAREFYEQDDEQNAKESERKAAVIQGRIDGLKKDLQFLQSQMEIWKRDYQTEESRCLETQEEPQEDGTKIVRIVYKRRFNGPLIRIERVTDFHGNVLEEAKMAAEHLLITLNVNETGENLLQRLQGDFLNVNLELKELSKRSRLYSLHFHLTLEHPLSRLETLTALAKKIKQEHGVQDCSFDYVMESCSSKVGASQTPPFIISEREPWSFYDSHGINPPEYLFDPALSPVPSPSSPIKIGILDSGILPTHEALKDCTLFHEDEYGEHFFGYNPLENSEIEKGRPRDNNGHGTHVAGIIAALPHEVREIEIKKKKANENEPDTFEITQIEPATIRGFASIPGMIKLIICKWVEPGQSEGLAEHAIQCIEYARDQGARILNCSWSRPLNGSGNFNKDKIQELKSKLSNDLPPLLEGHSNVVVVATAGNYKFEVDSPQRDKDLYPVYPASFGLPNLVSVAATNKKGILAKFSNFGKQSIQVTAPGRDIISTSSSGNNIYRMLSGTSMAAPHVTAAIALMMAKFSYLSCEKIVEHLCEQADKSEPPEIKVQYGRLHLALALMEPSSTKTASEEQEDELENQRILSLKKKLENSKFK